MGLTEIQLASDEERHFAEGKMLTLAPVHDGISPEDEPDSIRLAQQINGTPVANIISDSEDSSRSIAITKAITISEKHLPSRANLKKRSHPTTIATRKFIIGVAIATNIVAVAFFISV